MKGRRRSVVLLVVSILVGAVPGTPQAQSAGAAPTNPAWASLMNSMKQMEADMRSVLRSGDDDVDFVRLMLPHHQAAIEMAKAELMHGKDPQVRRLAQEVITDQQSEVQLMQLWLKQRQLPAEVTPAPAKEN